MYLPLGVQMKATSRTNDTVDSFNTINTFLPAGVLNAAVVKFVASVLAMRTEPAGTNLEACAII